MEDRSPQYRIGQLATRTGVEAARLRKWESRYGLLEPVRSRGGFRLYSLEDEQRVRLMMRHLERGYAAAEAASLAIEGIVSPSPARLGAQLPEGVVQRSSALLWEAAYEFDEGAAERALDDLFRAFTIDAVLRDAVLPFLRDLGRAWADGQASVGQEHFASRLIEARLMSLTRGWGSGGGPRALLACPPGERHTLGLLAFGIALSRHGWRITYLGDDTPVESIELAASATEPAIVVVAAADARWFEASEEGLGGLAGRERLAVAGAGASQSLAARLGAERIEADPVSAAAELATRLGSQYAASRR